MPDSPFQPGVEVAIQVQGGWRAPHSFKRGRVAKVHKNGNFVLEGSPQQWRPYAPSSYENFWRAGATGSGDGTLWLVNDDTKIKIMEQNQRANRYQRYCKVRNIIDREPFSERVTDEVLDQLEAATSILRPAKSDTA